MITTIIILLSKQLIRLGSFIMLKTLTFAILHFSVAFSIAYWLTGSIGISSAVALIEPMANTVVFYFHERAWKRYENKKMAEEAARLNRNIPLHQCVGN